MKRSISSIILCLLITATGISQNNADVQITLIPKYKRVDSTYSYRLYEEKADRLLENLKQANNCDNSKKGISRFRCQTIPGLDEKVTLRVHEGIESKNGVNTGFNTFYSEKYKSDRIANIKSNERLGIIVYILNNSRFNGNNAINSPDKKEIALRYIESLALSETIPNR